MAYENKDYIIPIRTSDDKTLYFSKNLLINNCRMLREIEGELSELMIPFPADIVSDFLSFLESYKLENILHVCQVADYLDLDFKSSFFITKEDIIDIFIEYARIDSKYFSHFFYYYKYLRINKIEISEDLNQLFINTKPFYREYDLQIDWDDIIQTLKAPEKLVDYYYTVYRKFNRLKMKWKEIDKTHPEYEKIKNKINEIGISITLEKYHDKLLDLWALYQ